MRQDGYSGIVYIESERVLIPRDHAIVGHWEARGDTLVDGPGWNSGIDAIAWARKRAPTVFLRVHRAVLEYRFVRVGELLVRLHAPIDYDYVTYDAGEIPWESVAGRESDPHLRRWPGARETREENVEAGYGGTVYLVQERPEDEGGYVGYTARWEALRDGVMIPMEVVGPRWEGDFAAAVTWARERAPYILIHHPLGYGYQSAGEQDLPGLNIPRWEHPDDVHARLVDELPPGQTYYTSFEPLEVESFPLPEDFIPAGGLPST